MHGFVSSIVAGVLAGGAVWVPPATPAFASVMVTAEPSGEPDPAELYDQGRKAYRLGDFEIAVEKWERAYELSDRPLLLYNISLAYKGLYGITKDIADLRRARAVLDNFIKLAEADPELEVDDAPERLAELDAMIAELEREEEAHPSRAGTGTSTGDTTQANVDAQPASEGRRGSDPGRVFKHAGIGLMAAGGAFVVTGVAVGVYYAVRGAYYQDRLQQTYDRAREYMCVVGDPAPTGPCVDTLANIPIHRRNGQLANRGAVISLGVGLGLGVATLATGAALYVVGKQRTRKWERGLGRNELNLHWTGRGIAVSGRF